MPKKSKEPAVSAPQEKKSVKAVAKSTAKPSTKAPAKKEPLPLPPVVAKEPPKAPAKKAGKKKEEVVVPAKVSKPVKVTKTLSKAEELVIPLEEISQRAYFIAERRQKMGWPGDSASDWMEAETQLKAEAVRGKKKSSK
jgi:hypothetical protein